MLVTVRDIAEKLLRRAEEIVQMLLPGGKLIGREWCAGDVTGQSGRSLKVNVEKGVWSDFATGQAGDLLDLWSQVRWVSLAEAIRQAKAYLGIVEANFEPRRKSYRRPDKPQCQRPMDDPVGRYLTEERKLPEIGIRAYKIGAQGRKIVFPYLRDGELIFFKYLDLDRKDGKKIISVEAECEPCLFGWQAISDHSREVVICEGEIDAVSLWAYGRPALSVPFGGGDKGKQSWIENEFSNLERFETIYLCMDSDHEGKAAASAISERLGRHRCRIVRLPHKDANECLKLGIPSEEIENSFLSAATIDPNGLRDASSYVEEVIEEFYPPQGKPIGVTTPWRKTGETIRFKPAELSIWTGISGHGKTMILNQITLETIAQGEKVCIASFEMKPRKLLYLMTRQCTGGNVPSVPLIRQTHEWFRGRLLIFDFQGTTNREWIAEVFKYARHRYGVTHFVLDSLMKCGIAEDDYNAQKLFVEELTRFTHEHDVHVHLVAHARKGEDEHHAPGKLDVKGTGAITDLADNVFSVWRNKQKEKALAEPNLLADKRLEWERKPDARISCEKQRSGEWEGIVSLWWHGPAFQYIESENSEPRNYLGESSPQAKMVKDVFFSREPGEDDGPRSELGY